MRRRPNQLALLDSLSPPVEAFAFRHTPPRQEPKPMPLVTITLAKREPATSPEKKAQLIAGVTDLLVATLGKRAEDVVVLIEEVDPDNWGQGGITATELRRRRAKTSNRKDATP
jgi:4-oxalocrotonate tautomerase